MNAMSRLSKIGAAVAVVAAMAAPGVARADAVAQSILDVTSFTFRIGNGAAGVSPTLVSAAPEVTVVAFATTSDALAVLNGGAAVHPTLACVGTCGAYLPFVELVGAPTATYSGSNSVFAGDALTVGATAGTDATVSLDPVGDGTTTGNVNLGATFTIVVGAPISFEVAFSAESFMRGFLDTSPGNATASTNWSISVTDSLNLPVFAWSPNGQGGGIFGGTEYADAFNMNDTVSQLIPGNTTRTNLPGLFEAETAILAAGTYTVSLRHTSSADAEIRVIPEPATLSLISIALLGAGAALRRRQRG